MDRAREVLRAAEHISDSFLETFPATVGVSIQDSAPESTERYRIGAPLGAGGMATVYEAHDLQLDRPVALKVLHSGPADGSVEAAVTPSSTDETLMGSRSVQLSLREARAQARVRHAHVLEVYETGELQGRPFIAMRYVPETSLGGRSLGDIPDLTLEQQVALWIQVCDGLDAAHRLGLVHRDVKLSNILVEASDTGELHAWIADFGIASGIGSPTPASETKTAPDDDRPPEPIGVVTSPWVGTAAYLAPERLGGPQGVVDRRVDVFSLGVVMYRLLTGRMPFDGKAPMEILHRIQHDEPIEPRHWTPTLPRDLQAVVLKCLAKDPDERYQTAAALGADLRRFLKGEVVEAHAAGTAYRFTKLVLRHRSLFTLGAIAGVMLVAALAVAAVLGLQAIDANADANIRRDQAEKLVSFMVIDLREKLDALGRLDLLDDVGRQALDYFAAVPEERLSDEELARRATALHQIGEVRFHRGDLTTAREAFEESLALAKIAVQKHPTNGDRLFDLGQSEFWVGHTAWKQANLAQASEHFETYLDISQRLVEMDPSRNPWWLELAYAHSNLGTVRRDQGNASLALFHYEKSLDIRRRLAEAEPKNFTYRRRLGLAHNQIGVILEASGRAEEALTHFKDHLKYSRELVTARPEHAHFLDDLAVAHNYLGSLRLRSGSVTEARSDFQAAVDIYRRLVTNDPENTHWTYRLAINLGQLGLARLELRQSTESPRRDELAMQHFQQQQHLLTHLVTLAEAPRAWRFQLAMAHHLPAIALLRRDDSTRARSHLETSLELLAGLSEEDPEDAEVQQGLALTHLLLGDVHQSAGNPEDAKHHWRRTRALLAEPVQRSPVQRSPVQRSPASRSRDHRVLAPWAAAMTRLGMGRQASDAVSRLREVGICAPYFHDLCRPPGESSRFSNP